MKRVAVVGCGAYMDSWDGCPGEWRCLKAAAQDEHKFTEPSSVVAFIRCECPGRTVIPSLGMAKKPSEIKPDAIHLSSCLAGANPKCPYIAPEEPAKLIESKRALRWRPARNKVIFSRTAFTPEEKKGGRS